MAARGLLRRGRPSIRKWQHSGTTIARPLGVSKFLLWRPAIQPRKVLIVDDEYLIRWALIKTLKEAGYEVAAAEDGMEAFEMAEKECFDFVITDLSMPGLDGWSLLEMLVHLPVSPRVIVITAHGEENFLTRVKDSGGWAYVEKSCLIDGVKEVLEAASLG